MKLISKEQRKELEKKKEIYKERLKYFCKQHNQVYICEINYFKKPLVRFGYNNIKEPYKREYEVDDGIMERIFEDESHTYVTYDRGEYIMGVYDMLKKSEKVIVLYRPMIGDFSSRDDMLKELFMSAKEMIEKHYEIAKEKYDAGAMDLEAFNERIVEGNLAKWEVEQLMGKYCNTQV